jgi:hypothetical protein
MNIRFLWKNHVGSCPHRPNSGSERRAQVAFASGQFWVLVVVDFVMLVMRDVRAC